MPGNNNREDELFDDPAAEEERLAAEEQAELDAADEERAGEQPDATAEDNVESLFGIMEKLKTENEELKDRMLRTAAEMENLRRRTQREIGDARAYSTSSFARDMLSVGDNLRRAIDAVPDEARASGEAGLASLIEGVEMTEREMLSVLEKNGVKKISPENEKFDPNFHQAMFEVPNPGVPNNTVVQVVQEGYVIGDRVLRPAMVGVAKGGPKIAVVADDVEAETSGADTTTAEQKADGESAA